MIFTPEGHVHILPKQVESMLNEPERLISAWLLPGTPKIFSARSAYELFLSAIAERLGVHPMNVCIRGSAKIGFSISPRMEKVWMSFGPGSDVDIAIVDVDYYNLIDRELKRWLRNADVKSNYRRMQKIRESKGFECFKYFDMPPSLSLAKDHNECFSDLAGTIPEFAGRDVTAFVYRDWWSVLGRYKADLRDLELGRRGLLCARRSKTPLQPLPAAPAIPRTYELV